MKFTEQSGTSVSGPLNSTPSDRIKFVKMGRRPGRAAAKNAAAALSEFTCTADVQRT